MHHSEQKCTHFSSGWCIVGYGRCIVGFVRLVYYPQLPPSMMTSVAIVTYIQQFVFIIWSSYCHESWAHFIIRLFQWNSKSTTDLFSWYRIPGEMTVTNFDTCHDYTPVLSCAKFCSDRFVRIWMRAKRNFYRIWIVMGKSFSEFGLRAYIAIDVPLYFLSFLCHCIHSHECCYHWEIKSTSEDILLVFGD